MMILRSDCLPMLADSARPVVILATTPVGEAIHQALLDRGVNVAAFCDAKPGKAGSRFSGLEVVHTPEVGRRFPQARVVIAVADAADAVEQLLESGIAEEDIFSAASLLADFSERCERHKYSRPLEYMRYAVSSYINAYMWAGDESALSLRSVDVVVTERCSLRCRDCSNLMAYYASPKDFDSESVLDAAARLCASVDGIAEFRVIGGEPLMNRDWVHVVEGLLKLSQDRYVVIYTNGTILPTEVQLDALKGERVVFNITDYGLLSRNLEPLCELLARYRIAYTVVSMDGWVDCGKVRPHNRTAEQLKRIYADCCAKNLYSLLGGELYRCPFAANANNLRAIPQDEGNGVDLLDTISCSELRRRIEAYVTRDSFLPACDFCNGRSYFAPSSFPPAIQASAALPYQVY